MNIFLTYYKCKDDWNDERSIPGLVFGKLLENKEKKSEKLWSKKVQTIVSCLDELSELEKENATDIDRVSGCFGRIMAEIFAYREDVWEPTLRRGDFYFGKFIYLLDAYDDVEEDVKKGNYNPFSKDYIIKGFDDRVKSMLMMMMAETCREFVEKLPIIKIYRYSSEYPVFRVWCRFETVSGKRKKEQEKETCFDPYSVLGVSRDASDEEIKSVS